MKAESKDIIEVVNHDLRALLFWAGVGVSQSLSGSYSDDIEEIIRFYSQTLGLKNKLPKFRTVMP